MSFVSVAIDGPAGAGKSTIARRVANDLGYLLIIVVVIFTVPKNSDTFSNS